MASRSGWTSLSEEALDSENRWVTGTGRLLIHKCHHMIKKKKFISLDSKKYRAVIGKRT